MSEPSPYCGRLDPHAAHEWLGRKHTPAREVIVRDCPGQPVIEGGNPAAIRWPGVGGEDRDCEGCGKRVHLPHDPACSHGHVVCDGCEIAEVCGWCAEAIEREALAATGEATC